MFNDELLNGGLSRLKESFLALNPSEQIAAKYIMEHPKKMIKMTVSELAQFSGSSRSAIIRLCKTIGFKSYQELKISIAGDLNPAHVNGDAYKEINPGSDFRTIAESVSNNHIFSINETLKILDIEKMKMALEWMKKARRIDFYGAGASQLVARDAQSKFMRISKPCTAYADSHLQLTSAVTLSEEDVAFAFSYSGETSQVLTCIKTAKEAGAKTIAITRYGNNSLKQLADLTIEIASSESDIRSAATSSRIVQLTVIDIIYLAIAGCQYQSSLTYLQRSQNVLQKGFRL